MKDDETIGLGVDAYGGPVIDPTENVKQLVLAETRRQDDLRAAEASAVRELMGLRAGYDEKLRDAESKRIDAIRAVDVGAVNRAAEVSATQATTLAAQVATSAETLRTQVAAAATAAATALAAALEPLNIAIADLRRSQWEAQGKQGQVSEQRSDRGLLVAAIGVGISILIALIAVAAIVAART